MTLTFDNQIPMSLSSGPSRHLCKIWKKFPQCYRDIMFTGFVRSSPPWPLTLKILSVHPWILVNVCSKLEDVQWRHYWDMVSTWTDGQRDNKPAALTISCGNFLLLSNKTKNLEFKWIHVNCKLLFTRFFSIYCRLKSQHIFVHKLGLIN